MLSLLVAVLLGAQQPPPPPPQDTTKRDTTKVKLDSLPLKMERTVSFETSEATWMSLDVSPDGKTIVFELMGDLYTMPVTGGSATRITSGPAFDSQPRWSPDGKRIVFLSDLSGAENVWLCDPDGSNKKALTKGTNQLYASPEWTPEGNYIVVSRTSGVLGSTYELWLIHKDGGSGAAMLRVQPAPNAPAMNTLGAAFGKDPRYIWVSRHRGGFGYNLEYPLWQLAIYDRQTGRLFTQTDVYGSAMRPVLSSDGKWLVYATRYDAETGLRLRNLASGDEKWLVYPVTRDDQESRFTRDLYPGYSFTPDNQALIISYGGKVHRVAVPSGQVTDIPFTAKVDQQLGPMVHVPFRVDTGQVLVRQIRNASPSPDGKRLAFSALDRLYVMDLPNGTPRRLTNDDVKEQVPAWSPDGQWLAYVTWSDQGGTLNKIKATPGSKPVRLSADSAFYDTPVWSPDGARIVVVRGPRAPREQLHFAPGYEIDWVPSAGGTLTKISPINAWGRPHFSKDPNRIYIYEGPEGLVSMRYDGTDRRQHIRVTGYTYPGPASEPDIADEILINPDSGSVLAVIDNYVYIVTLPVIGGQTPVLSISDPSSAAFPVKRLTMIGGEFAGWTNDGKQAYWSAGRSFLQWDPAVADSMEKLKQRTDSIRSDSLKGDAFKALPDSVTRKMRARADSLAKLPAYEPQRVDVTINVPRDIPRSTVVLRGARVVTMKGDEVIENADIVVKDNRIVSVGAQGTAPAGARVIDVSGKTIIPGFVDIHAHPWPIGGFGIHETQVWPYLANLAWGVTTVRDPQTSTTDVLTYSDLVETGDILGPRVYHTGPGVFWSEDFKSLDDTKQALRRYSEFYRINTIKMYMTGNRKQRQWVIMAAKDLGLMPTIEGGLDFKMDLTTVIDGYPGNEHSYPLTPLYKDAVQLVAQSGVTYTPTLLVSYGGPFSENFFYERYDIHDIPKVKRFMPHEEIDQRAERRPWFRENQYVFPRIAASANAILQAGGFVGLGGHGQMDGLGDHWELWAMAAGGMKPLDVLRVATINGAHAIGMEQDLGSLEPGKLADLIVLDANPLEDIHNTNTVRYVMKNGRLYEGETLNEIYPRQRQLPKMWWWGTEPTSSVAAPN